MPHQSPHQTNLRQHQPFVGDGAYGTLFGAHDHQGPVDLLVHSDPDLVVTAHKAYVRAGAREIQSCSFLTYSLPAEQQARTYRAALNLARLAAAEGCRVVLTVGPAESEQAMRTAFEVAAEAADGVVVETITDSRTLQAIAQARDVLPPSVPLWVCGSLDDHARNARERIAELCDWARRLDARPGLNCCEGATEGFAAHARLLGGGGWPDPRLIPSAGVDTPQSPNEWAATLVLAGCSHGTPILGGCCGTTPEHIAAVARAVAAT